MKKYMVGLSAIAFAIVAFAFTPQGSSKKTLDCENVYWFVVSGTSTSDPNTAKAFAVAVDDLTDDSNAANDNFVAIGSTLTAINATGCENDDLPICAIAYPVTSLQRVLKSGSSTDYEWKPGTESVPCHITRTAP